MCVSDPPERKGQQTQWACVASALDGSGGAQSAMGSFTFVYLLKCSVYLRAQIYARHHFSRISSLYYRGNAWLRVYIRITPNWLAKLSTHTLSHHSRISWVI